MFEEFFEIDKALWKYSSFMHNFESFIKPLNEKREKKLFFKNKNYEPKFTFKNFDLKVKKFPEVPEGVFKNVYEEKIKETKIAIEFLNNLGRKENVYLSNKLYGKPKRSLLKVSEKILSESNSIIINNRERFSPKDFKRKIEYVLEAFNLKWNVEIKNVIAFSVSPSEKTIHIPRRKFALEEMKRLLVHEIFVHVIRTENGFLQPLRIFVIGFPKYILLEEGLAVYFENFFGFSQMMREYAARFFAVFLLRKECSFNEIFSELLALGFSHEKAWNITLRVFRGGGFTKDYVYLQGFFEVKRIVKKFKFNVIFCGKIDFKYLGLISSLIKSGEIRPAVYLPENIKQFI